MWCYRGRFATTIFSARQRCYVRTMLWLLETMSQQCCNAGSRLKSLLRFLSKYAAALVLKPFEISNAGQKLHQQKWGFLKKLRFMVQEFCTVVSVWRCATKYLFRGIHAQLMPCPFCCRSGSVRSNSMTTLSFPVTLTWNRLQNLD